MANTVIQLKFSTESGNVPSSLANGEISINNRDGKFFYSAPDGIVLTHYPYFGPSGLNEEVQFNDSGDLGSDSGLTYNKTTDILTVFGGAIVGGVNVTPQIQFAFTQANSAFIHANAAFNYANTITAGTDQWVRNQANAAFDAANSASIAANTPSHVANSAAIYANGAFAAANTAQDAADSAEIYANGAFVAANTADNKATSAGVYANGAFNAANTADNKATSAGVYANGAFVAANTADTKATSAGVYANGAFLAANNEAGVNLTQNTNIIIAQNTADASFKHANSSFEKSNSVSIYANGAFVAANNEAGVNATQNTNITNAQNTATAAFIRANNSLNANTGGEITGDLSITGNLSVIGNTFSISATNLVANDTLILLGAGNYTSDLLDIGISAHYNDGVNAHTGFIRDHGTKEWQLFEGYIPEIGANNDININDPSFRIAILNANLHSQFIKLNNQDLQTYIDNAYTKANNEAGVNATQNNSISAAFIAANSSGSYANSAFLAANAADSKAVTAGSYANSAFTTANNEAGVNATQNNSITASFTAANSAGNYANSAFAAANTADVKATSAGIYANGAFVAANNEAGVNATQNNNISAASSYANSAFAVANSASIYANGAFIRANNSINANVGGTITGNTTIVGNLFVTNTTTAVSTTSGALRISGGLGVTGNIYADAVYDGGVEVIQFANNAFQKANAASVRTISFVIDGAGSVIAAGQKGNVMVDFAGTINSWTVLGNASGSITIDVSKASYTNFPIFTASGGTSPALSSQQKNQNVGINWTGFTTVSANDIIRFVVSGTPTTVTLVTVALKITTTV